MSKVHVSEHVSIRWSHRGSVSHVSRRESGSATSRETNEKILCTNQTKHHTHHKLIRKSCVSPYNRDTWHPSSPFNIPCRFTPHTQFPRPPKYLPPPNFHLCPPLQFLPALFVCFQGECVYILQKQIYIIQYHFYTCLATPSILYIGWSFAIKIKCSIVWQF